MNRNVGTIDRILRLVLGVALLVWGLSAGFGATLPLLATIAGAVLVGTAAVSFCPLYRIIGLTTCRNC